MENNSLSCCCVAKISCIRPFDLIGANQSVQLTGRAVRFLYSVFLGALPAADFNIMVQWRVKMGTIKDLIDLVTQLTDSVKDRKFAAELREIQRMISNLQSEQAALYEQNFKLMADNKELTQTIYSLQQEIAECKDQEICNKKMLSLKFGVLWDKENNSYCPVCEKPTSQVTWGTFDRRQCHSLFCPNCNHTYVLKDKNGAGIHYMDALKVLNESGP